MLFDAGATSGISGWNSIWSKLPDDTTAIRYSRRGEGGSSACHGDLSAKDYVDDVEKLFKTLKISTPIIYVSHSYGSKVAREYAKRNPSKITAMLFLDPINPRDVEIIESLDPINGAQANEGLKQSDLAKGAKTNWCLI
ncbi:alpha/beta fold hydrolase [Microbulbifer sp. 2304DJ12-6]|uniref:alpha/beta fold hydrolase n=1 Tax=Microbulbifer sp. 2304DJ12-6 TaxID=3233340 RepID=UPI0039B083FF